MKPLSVRCRPKIFSDVVGQKVSIQILTNSFKAKDLHHAYVFAGKFGTGKTTVARILAAMENCKEGYTLTPCGECKNCKEIFNCQSNDIIEIDAGSTRGIDDIRSIKNEILYSPIECSTKYVIIDEAHSLTGAAAEALLKPIEEPPDNVRWILCTTELSALKPTIHSRCIVLWFTDVSWREIDVYLEQMVKKENIAIKDRESLFLIARKSKGSIRNSLQYLQSVVAFCGGNPITVDAVRDVLGDVEEDLFFRLLDNIAKYEVPEAMLSINVLMTKGRNVENIIEGLLRHLRNLMVVNACKKNVEGLGFTDSEIKKYKHQGKEIRPAVVSSMINFVREIQRAAVLNLDPHCFFEKFVIDSIVELVKFKRQNQS